MPSRLGELTLQAQQLVAAGDLAGARSLLSDALTDADPRPANATPELTEAAGLQAKILIALGEPHAARGWAAFGHAATTRLYGRSDERAITAAATLAAVLHQVGSDARAARLYSDVILELTARDGPESPRVLAAHADLATVEHARGQCALARDRLLDAWELHREVYGDGHPSGIKMLARLGRMQRDCGRYAEARESLALAEELTRQHLAPDDPLAAQVATLARAAPDPGHLCTDTTPTGGAGASGRWDVPVVPAARTPTPEEGPVDPLGHRSDTDSDPLAYPGVDASDPPAAEPDPFDRPEPQADPFTDAAWAYSPPDARQVPAPRPPSDTGRFHAFDDDGWWPPDQVADDPFPDPGRDPLPPAVVALAGTAEDPPGVRSLRPPADPEPSSRLLPVLVPRQPVAPAPRNRLLPLVVGGVVVVLLGAAAVIAGVSRFDTPADPAPTAPTTSGAAGPARPTATPRAAARPGSPPTAVGLRDRRDNIALAWTYPAGGEGPVVISAGRSGQEPRVFQQLPAGTDSFIVYGLDRVNDYCFTVAVVWSTDTVAKAAPVCTRRR
ncbi:tetratricopeptide repeat protein [Micromonospora siamensis]|uniref:Tetratricopeptide repeat-containing protein n=1 Tax=Micromonospora siamensis TaxID=299152 RepID=A0A1C5HVV3_9ACTN|nr:tetratricopeptide repeat protein [Micromonospora siamensis]SCG50119.1 Tetratricopeptide repeat-containing protein [Micromonospora siamensis]